MCSNCNMKADLTGFNNRVKWSYYYMYMQIHIEQEGGNGTLSAAKKVSQKSNLCICSGALRLVANAIWYFVRSVENDLGPSQTYTPASNLGYLASPQDNFSWVPNCLLGPPGWETKVFSKKFWFGLCEIAWFLWQPIANLRRGVCLQNYIYLSCYLS